MKLISVPLWLALATLASLPIPSLAWVVKDQWSTARFNCSGEIMEIGVDMNSRIGGGDAAPTRYAYMLFKGKRRPAVWYVGASMNSLRTVNTGNINNYELSLGKYTYVRGDDMMRGVNCEPI